MDTDGMLGGEGYQIWARGYVGEEIVLFLIHFKFQFVTVVNFPLKV